MQVLLRLEVNSNGQALALDDIAVLRAESRKGFHANINDPNYRKIRADRLNAVSFFAVLERTEAETARLQALKSADKTRVKLCYRIAAPGTTGIRIKFNLAGQVKGRLPLFLKSVCSIVVEPALSSRHIPQCPNALNGRIIR